MKVVFRVFNDASVVDKVVESLRGLEKSGCVLVDAGSTDGTIQKLQRAFPDAQRCDHYAGEGLYIETHMELQWKGPAPDMIECVYDADNRVLQDRIRKPGVKRQRARRIEAAAPHSEWRLVSLRKHDRAELDWYMRGLEVDYSRDAMSALAHYEARPHRLEPLYMLIKRLRRKSCNLSAHLLAERALLATRSATDVIDVQTEIYAYKLLFELSVVAFYNDQKRAGLDACNALLALRPAIEEASIVRRNLIYYVPALRGLRTTELLSAIVPEGCFITNPSVCCIDKRTTINLRCVNHTAEFTVYCPETKRYMPLSVKHHMQTFNIRDGAMLEPTLDVPTASETARCRGLEDLRLFAFRGKVCFIATSQGFNDAHVNQMYLNCGSSKRVVCVQAPEPRFQKNWLPFESPQGALLAIYTMSPLVVLRIDPDDGTTSTVHSAPQPSVPEDCRGSAGPLPGPGGQLYGITHQVLHNRTYVHRFFRMNPDFSGLQVSRQFRMQTQFAVSYVCGMLLDKKSVTITWGKNDEHAMMSTLAVKNMLDLFD